MTTQPLDLTQIAVAVVALILTIIARYVVPYVKAKISAENTKKLCVWTEVAVKAAEQLCKSGAIEKEARKEHVIKFLSKQWKSLHRPNSTHRNTRSRLPKGKGK